MISVTGKLNLDGRGWDAGIRGAEKSADRFANHLSTTVKARIGAVFSTALVTAMARKVIDFASNISDLSARLGVAADELQRFFFAAKQSGGSDEAVVSFLEKLNVARAKALGGSAEMIAAFKELGVTLDDLKAKRVEDLAKQIASLVQKSDPQKVIAPLREVGGRAVGELIATFVNGLEEVGAMARVISNENVESLDAAGDSISEMATLMVVELAPAIVTVMEWLRKFTVTLRSMGAFFGSLFGDVDPSLGPIERAKKRIKDALSARESVVVGAEEEKIKVESERKRRKETLASLAGQGFEETPDTSKFGGKIEKVRTRESDSLTRVGNFLGAAGQQTIVSIQQGQLDKLSSIDRTLLKMASGKVYGYAATLSGRDRYTLSDADNAYLAGLGMP